MEKITELSLEKPVLRKVVKKKAPVIVEYLKKADKQIHVEFEKIFGEHASVFDDFTISLIQKKAYGNNIPLICDENKRILSRNQTVTEKYLYAMFVIKKTIDTGMYNEDALRFTGDLVSQILTMELINEVEAYVDEFYEFDVDSTIEIEKFDPGTTFMNRHFKIIYVIANLCRLVIPLATHFVFISRKIDPRKFFYDVFINICLINILIFIH